jgi:peptidoglycan hydrolase CwlO-like protein
MTKDDQIKVLQDNVMELQGQLAEAQKRIKELNDLINIQQQQLSYYKNESI